MTYVIGECSETLRTLEPCSMQMCVTSPPYWGLRSYVDEDQMILRRDLTPEQLAYVVDELRKAGLL